MNIWGRLLSVGFRAGGLPGIGLKCNGCSIMCVVLVRGAGVATETGIWVGARKGIGVGVACLHIGVGVECLHIGVGVGCLRNVGMAVAS